MLKIRNVCKSFKDGRKNKNEVLKNVTLDFKKRELVFILGTSGSGKSTLLNIIGGLLKPTSGEIFLDDISITKLKNRELDNYRNSIIGFIFQDYHLIEYMSVKDNIKICQTIRKNSNQIEIILKQLGIYDKRNLLVNKLSGGEKQRVAIARAIINDPKIILADEPTGALDSENGTKIMNILKNMSENRLVIVVSHDNYLANKYADRIINIKDGQIDYIQQEERDLNNYKIGTKNICILSIIKLAIKNLWLKKGRTILNSLAVSLGFICMMIILCLSRGFKTQVNDMEKEAVSLFPISVSNGDYDIFNEEIKSDNNKINIKRKNDYIFTNKINNNFINYVNKITEINYINYGYDISMPIISDTYKLINNDYVTVLPNKEYIDDNYSFVGGRNIENKYEILLKIDSHDMINEELANAFSIYNSIEYKDIINRKIRIVLNDQYYIKINNDYKINKDYKAMYDNCVIELVIVGIIKEKGIINDNSGIFYDNELLDIILKKNTNSLIVKDQLISDNNILNLDISKDAMLSFLGYKTLPNQINIYVNNINDKNMVIKKLDDYNKYNDKIIYNDTMREAIDILKSFINIISIVLIIFSSISILVSSLMISILTNTRVIERTKEIGILRSLGARKKDIINLFNFENMFIGLLASTIGMIIVKLLTNPINTIFSNVMDSDNVLVIYRDYIIIAIIINIFICILSGYIPARRAGKKNIIDCIYMK